MTTNYQPVLAQIIIYPIKSLDGKIVDRSKISPGGALSFDRRWAIVDANGKIVNAKRTAKIQQIRSRFDFVESEDRLLVSLSTADDPNSQIFCLTNELVELANWLSEFFGFPVNLIENVVGGFPDDLAAYGPTIISTATLLAVCDWFPDLDLAEVRRRFRTNLELSDVPAFWEDRLFTSPDAVVDFQLGNVQFQGINPCQRCIVPTRDSLTGNVTAKFQQIFNQHRQQTVVIGTTMSRFNHFYRLAVNTKISDREVNKNLNIGDLTSFF
ncbi:MAG: MOSC N-terminal beta barrel domain-containing protein [Chamaesiphon sp.]|nr:MOSC N-terminal beta barrel domain-containing protein [Chamaesiphon sp.]